MTVFSHTNNYPGCVTIIANSNSPKYFGAASSGSSSFYMRIMAIYDNNYTGNGIKSIMSNCAGTCIRCISTLPLECISCDPLRFLRNNTLMYGECSNIFK